MYLVALACLVLLGGRLFAQPGIGPAGIFVIGDTRYVPGEVAKFDYDFVSGYTLRASWTDLETWDETLNQPLYNFARIATTLEEARVRGKRVTIEIFINKAPDYVLSQPGTVTWNNPHPSQGGVQPVPWDANTLAAYQGMLQHLAQWPVPNTNWTIGTHPSLESVDASIIGLQGLRELSGTLVQHPDYGRDKFVQAVVDSVAACRSVFAGKHGFLAMFAMDDGVGPTALDEAVMTRLKESFNNPGQPTLGFFQETLSDTGPSPTGLGKLLVSATSSTFVMFQALRPWTLRAGESVSPEVASGTPVTGLTNAYQNYSSLYVELYGADILNTANQQSLRVWNEFFNAAKRLRSGTDRASVAMGQQSNLLRLTWPTNTWQQYKIWESTDFLNWSPSSHTGAADGDLELVMPTATGSRFFRVELLMPGAS